MNRYIDWGDGTIHYVSPDGADLFIHPASDPDFIIPEPPVLRLEFEREQKLKKIAAARFAAETGGFVINGMTIDTSRESQALITGAALQATIDPAYICQWKTASGFVTLTAEQILAVAVAVRQHVQACFNREAELAGTVEAAETVEEVEAIAWTESL